MTTTTKDCHRRGDLVFNPSSSNADENAQLRITSSSDNNYPSMSFSLPSSPSPPPAQILLSDRSMSRATNSCRNSNSNSSSKRFITQMALTSTACAVILLLSLTLLFSEWKIKDIPFMGDSKKVWIGEEVVAGQRRQQQQRQQQQHLLFPIQPLDVGSGQQEYHQQQLDYRLQVHHRHLDQEESGNINNNQNDEAANGDYSSYRCDEIFNLTSTSSSSSSPSERCMYARTCDEGSGLLLPFVFCHTTLLSTRTWMILLSPPLLLLLTLLFRLLGSTADDYFSPSLEMFSTQLGLPPRFAGVTLLALGNGASDVSATMNAIASDPENGYKMSLGALTGGAMFVTTVVAGSVILAGGGVVCRGALVRDVAALGVTVIVVAWNLEKGVVGPGVSVIFCRSQ